MHHPDHREPVGHLPTGPGILDVYFLKTHTNKDTALGYFTTYTFNRNSQAHMKAQKVSKEQQLDMMNKCYKQLESRLDDMLSQIAKETEEIRDLEQQLTDGKRFTFFFLT